MFYHATKKERLDDRNKIVINFGIPALQNNGFKKSPFRPQCLDVTNIKTSIILYAEYLKVHNWNYWTYIFQEETDELRSSLISFSCLLIYKP